MLYSSIEKWIKQKTFYVVTENGWCYAIAKEIFFTKEEAINYWEKLTHKDYKKDYQYYSSHYNHNSEGFWYYGIDEITGEEFLTKCFERVKSNTIYNEAFEIEKRGKQYIRGEVEKRTRKNFEKIIKLFESFVENYDFSENEEEKDNRIHD